MRFALTKVGFACSLLCMGVVTLAQESTAPIGAAKSLDVEELPPVVVTASKLSEPQKNVTQKITVVTQEEFAKIGSPIRMVPGVGRKLMSLCCAGAPPRGPIIAETAIANLGAFVRRKKGHPHLLPLEHLSHQRRDFHVAGIQSQIQRFITVFFGTSA